MALENLFIERDIEEAFAIYDWHRGFTLLRAVIADGEIVDEELVFRAIEIAVELRKSKDAQEFLAEYRKMIPEEDFIYHYFIGRIARMEKRYLDAVVAITLALQHTEDDVQMMLAYSVRSSAYDAMEDYDLAILDYQRVLEINEKWYIGRCLYAWALFNNEEYVEAEKQFHIVRDTSHGDTEVDDCHYGIGISCFMQSKYHEAIEAFNEAIKLADADANTYYYRGLSYLESSVANFQTEFGIADFLEVLKLVPEHSHALARIGDSYFKMERFAEAIKTFEEVRVEHKLSVRSELSLAWSYYFLAEEDEAYQDTFARFAEIVTKNRAAFYEGTIGMAQCAYGLKDYVLVQSLVQKILRVDQGSAQANALLGWTIYKQAQNVETYEAALAYFEIALTTQAENSDALRGRAYTYKMLNQYPEALADYEVLADADDTAEIAWIKGSLGEHFAAIMLYMEAIAAAPDEALLYEQLATMYALAGDTEQALAIYEDLFQKQRTPCGLVQYADLLRQHRNSRPHTSEQINALYMEAYILQSVEERKTENIGVCTCARSRLIHCQLTSFGIARDDDFIIDVLLEGMSLVSKQKDFLLLYAYIFAHGIGVEISTKLAIAAVKTLVETVNDVHAWYVYACLVETTELRQKALEKIARYRNLAEPWVLEAIDANISAGTFEFFYPMR